MQSNKWGKHGWEFLHSVSFNYPIKPLQEDRETYRFFFESVKKILPCKICRDSFTFFYDNIPIDEYLDDRNGVVYWLYIMHNIVNLKLSNKLESFKDILLKYENQRAKCGNINTKDKELLSECQKDIDWNDAMEEFYQQTIDKYEKKTIETISKLIKNNREKQDVINILLTINELHG
jgi:hypothetical protein